MRQRRFLILLILIPLALVAAALLALRTLRSLPRNARVVEWIRNPERHPDWIVPAGTRCGDAPFLFPTRGYVGFLWDDSFRPFHRHSGLDIFSGEATGVAPVYAAYDGYLTRLPEWKSSLILRVPSDPLQPGRQIWLYYTHLADSQGYSLIDEPFPPGSNEVFVPAGRLLGWQGNFSGTPGAPVGVHLHFSIVKDDGQGKFLDERRIANTLDPSPYFGMSLSAAQVGNRIVSCESP